MSDELQSPSVIDFDQLLAPISEESPAGEDLRYSGIYDEIREARRADDTLAQGEWKSDVKVADFRRVVELSTGALATQSKDIQVAAWLTEALLKLHGFTGIRDGAKLLAALHEAYWESMFPEIDEGDMESRANAISWVDTQVALLVKEIPFTGVTGYSFNDWERSQRLILPDNIDDMTMDQAAPFREALASAEASGGVTPDRWTREIQNTKRAQVELVNQTILECWEAFDALVKVVDEKFDRNQTPGVTNMRKGLDEVHTQVKKLLDQKREEEPDPVELIEEESAEGSEGGESSGGKGGKSGPINSRREALARLAEIAGYFQATEPHSPVSYLVQRAVRWGNMPLENWLQEVIKDQNVLSELKETLGVAGGGGGDFS